MKNIKQEIFTQLHKSKFPQHGEVIIVIQTKSIKLQQLTNNSKLPQHGVVTVAQQVNIVAQQVNIVAQQVDIIVQQIAQQFNPIKLQLITIYLSPPFYFLILFSFFKKIMKNGQKIIKIYLTKKRYYLLLDCRFRRNSINEE